MKQRAMDSEDEDEMAFEQAGRDLEEDKELEFDGGSSSSKKGGGGGRRKNRVEKEEKVVEVEQIKEKEKVRDEEIQSKEEEEDLDREDQEQEDDSDQDDEEDDEDEEDENDEDDEEIEEYETSLGMNGEERDEYGSEGGGSEDGGIPRPPRTFNASGEPLSSDHDTTEAERQAAMDEADALFGALARAGGAGGGPGGGGPGGIGGAFQALRGMMSGMTGRLKGLLASLKDREGGTAKKLMALQELAELLSI